ncbi:immunoglobulin domain-containing protein [Geothrix sp. 21YS21S-2]|uniref:immunoglobulin domain-containing protein n=1 Tax=Geothrix sp. 21YS21S-2 TaxID=3068893 RepID=UPI0027B8AC24|nr:immunoglobulin domain-containing protein [Geothrix sp. 21YS21S-2]
MRRRLLPLLLAAASILPGQSTQKLPNNTGSSKYVVFAWNDLGMHCLNPTYDKAVILPPYNTIQAQVVQRGNPPVVVTTGVNLSYSILGNTTSANKGNFGQFWTNAFKLFGASPALDHGLNLDDPSISNGLSGAMIAKGNRFVVNGIPLTPINDAGVWNPYQTGLITVKDASGATVARTQIVVPTSDEINCAKCHGSADPLGDILHKHDAKHLTNLVSSAPVLCASCHGSPVLNQTGRGSAGTYLSEAIHGSHATRGAACYDCHPGASTRCNRSLAHTDATGACTNCHGSMANVAATSLTKARTPWVNEPSCSQCHTNVPGVDTAGVLFRNASGHGNMACTACHNSPHAMLPSSQAMDTFTAAQYQGTAAAPKAIGSCGACHASNHGEGFSDWRSEHGSTGTSTESACNVCHTGFQNPVQVNFPHGFQWNARTATVGSGPVKNVPVTETPLPGAPVIATQPRSLTVTLGQTATFSVQVSGTTPVTYQWFRNSVAVAGATGAAYTTPAAVVADNGAVFTVVVKAAGGSVTSQPATLTLVVGTVSAPAITAQPANLTVRAGATATFSVTATGSVPLTYQWRRNGVAIPAATGSRYTTPSTVPGDSGTKFTVVVTNSAGSAISDPATLTVTTTGTAPRITTQPTNQQVRVGQTARFTVVATGSAPLRYQWYKNGTAVANATAATYSFAVAPSDRYARIHVMVANPYGSAKSNTVWVSTGD